MVWTTLNVQIYKWVKPVPGHPVTLAIIKKSNICWLKYVPSPEECRGGHFLEIRNKILVVIIIPLMSQWCNSVDVLDWGQSPLEAVTWWQDVGGYWSRTSEIFLLTQSHNLTNSHPSLSCLMTEEKRSILGTNNYFRYFGRILSQLCCEVGKIVFCNAL